MSYEDDYPETVEIPEDIMSEAQKIIVTGLIRQGEFNAREKFIEIFEEEVSKYLEEVDGEPNMEWIDGVRYCIHLVKEVKSFNA